VIQQDVAGAGKLCRRDRHEAVALRTGHRRAPDNGPIEQAGNALSADAVGSARIAREATDT
jgi:hypothetical protein